MCRKKRAWLYCRIDAPEDEHGRLKGHAQGTHGLRRSDGV